MNMFVWSDPTCGHRTWVNVYSYLHHFLLISLGCKFPAQFSCIYPWHPLTIIHKIGKHAWYEHLWATKFTIHHITSRSSTILPARTPLPTVPPTPFLFPHTEHGQRPSEQGQLLGRVTGHLLGHSLRRSCRFWCKKSCCIREILPLEREGSSIPRSHKNPLYNNMDCCFFCWEGKAKGPKLPFWLVLHFGYRLALEGSTPNIHKHFDNCSSED